MFRNANEMSQRLYLTFEVTCLFRYTSIQTPIHSHFPRGIFYQLKQESTAKQRRPCHQPSSADGRLSRRGGSQGWGERRIVLSVSAGSRSSSTAIWISFAVKARVKKKGKGYA